MQYCDGFCHPSHESAIGIHVSPPPEPHFPPHHIPPGCHRALALVPCVIHQTLTGYLFHVGNVYVSMLSLKSSHPLLLPLSPKVSSLCLPAWECYAAMKRREVLARAAAQMSTGTSQIQPWKWSRRKQKRWQKTKTKKPAERQSCNSPGSPGDLAVE